MCHLVRLENLVTLAFIKKDHLKVVVFYLVNAYDKTCKFGIMKDLTESNRKFDSVHSFLKDRGFQIRFRKHSKSYTHVYKHVKLCGQDRIGNREGKHCKKGSSQKKALFSLHTKFLIFRTH